MKSAGLSRKGGKMEIKWQDEDSPHMLVREEKGVTFLTWQALEEIPGLIHGFSTRLGGVSQGIYETMNLSFTRGDREEDVRENYRRISAAMGFSPEDIVTSDQTHTTNVRVVTYEDRGNGITKPRPYKDIDGMVTNVPGVILATFYADCVPLYFVDPVKRAIGLSHSGWRGTVGHMGRVTVEKMREEYGSKPEDICCGIGPSICQECYEVSGDVIEEFCRAFEKKYWDGLFYPKGQGKYQLNLWEANRIILLESGIRKERIFMPGICTCCNPEFLFSHRASKGKRGNLGAFLGLKNEEK